MRPIISHKKTIYASALLLILLLSITYRFSLLENIATQDITSVTEKDTVRYEKPALHFLEHGTFAINPTDIHTTTIHDQPGYALFIAANYYLFKQDKHQLLKVQIIVSALSILILSLAAFLLWSYKASLSAATIMALDPLQTLYSHVMLTETLQIFFVSLIVLFAVLMLKNSNRSKNPIWALLFGLAIALATYVHAVNYYLVLPIVIGLMLFRKYLQWDMMKLVKIVVLILLPVVILLSAWQIRNGQLTGVYQFSDNSSTTLLHYKASSVYMQKDNLSFEEAVARTRHEVGNDFMSLQDRYDAEKELAKEIIGNNLGAFLTHSLKGYIPLMFGVGLDSYAMHYDPKYYANLASGGSLQTNPVIRYIENMTGKQFWYVALVGYGALFLLGCYALALIGFTHAFKYSAKEYRVIHLLLLGLAAYYLVLATGHIDAYHRQRLTSMIVILLYASNGALLVLHHLYYLFRQRKEQSRSFRYKLNHRN
ncbi:MAG: Unknown protein [uncultured Thiotrichaceae bacterium]|uniref:Glycosyltransferase RgtA/B/C/D-like domain-containing protein n=1 Tax=uncultured Thiotrichaceae bacterium TaxID=298394 RepID=A0A6S6SD14_9GAMM|nr:MAG: Unknown protein [uncultured Thiotrichaceae bacterium]